MSSTHIYTAQLPVEGSEGWERRGVWGSGTLQPAARVDPARPCATGRTFPGLAAAAAKFIRAISFVIRRPPSAPAHMDRVWGVFQHPAGNCLASCQAPYMY